MKLKDIFLKAWRWIGITIVSIAIIIGFLALVGILGTVIKSNTALNIDNLPSKDGNLHHIWSGSDEESVSHFLFIKDLIVPIDTMDYLDLLNTCLIYMDTVPPSHYRQLPVREIIILKSLDGWVELRGHDNQDWDKIGANRIVIIERKEDSIINTKYRYENDRIWKHRNYKTFNNSEGNYTFESIK